MGKDNRVTYRRRHCYSSVANKIKKVKTPGGKLVAQYVEKRAAGPSCGDCGCKAIHGVPALRPKQYKHVAKHNKTVSRAYGGSRCAGCTKARIVRAFLIEEQKIVKKVMAEQLAAKKA